MFEGLLGDDKNSPIQILKDLMNKDSIEMKTQLNMKQIKQLCLLKWYSLLEQNSTTTPFELFDEVMVYYMQLLTSIDRQGRQEIIQGLSEMREKLIDTSILKPQEVK